MPEVINDYRTFSLYNQASSIFWIIEYRNVEEAQRYSLLRNECLSYPQDFKDRLNSGVYRIWTVTPREIPW